MVSTDPIADMLTRIRNANAVRQHSVTMPYSKLKEAVAQILKDHKYIQNLGVDGEGIEKKLTLTVSSPTLAAPFTEIERVSTPGRRVYAKNKEIPTVKNGRGIVIVSTSQGVMTGATAKSKNLGGEIICRIY